MRHVPNEQPTRVQLETLRDIAIHRMAFEESPTRRELADQAGVALFAITQRLEALERKGLIGAGGFRKCRTLTLTPAGMLWVSEVYDCREEGEPAEIYHPDTLRGRP